MIYLLNYFEMRRLSVSRNNCCGEIRLKHESFELSHRQVGIILPYNLLTDIESCEGKIECKVQPGFITCLLRLKSRELFGIAYAELNLKAGTVETYNPVRLHGYVGGEVKKWFSVLNRTDHDTDVAFQCPGM